MASATQAPDWIQRAIDVFNSVELPNYTNSEARPGEGKDNDCAYSLRRAILQAQLEQKANLPAALAALWNQQMDAGFIQDDLSEVKYFQCYRNRDSEEFFLGQFNKRRADRRKGAGRDKPPKGCATVATQADQRCFLCTDNIRWQHRGVQLYYQLRIDGRVYNALCNPFPFMPLHITMASDIHEPQSWQSVSDPIPRIERIVSDLYKIQRMAPRFVALHNGLGAGASIKDHLHFHLFLPKDGHVEFPLQIAAALAGAAGSTGNTLRIGRFYPLIVFRFRGDNAVHLCAEKAAQWSAKVGKSASANIIAIEEGEENHKETCLYLVPRHEFFSRSPGLSGEVGGCETLGEFIFCSDDEDRAIYEQRVTYDYMWNILNAVRPPGVEQL